MKPKPKTKNIEGYTIFLQKKLGQGSFGKVYIAEKNQNKIKCAVKMLDRKIIDKDEYVKNAVFTEIQILKTLKSPNIVGFYQVMQSQNYYYIIQQLCDGGDLKGLLQKKGKLNQQQAIELLKQICSGFITLIREGVIHRDLKPQNILIHQGLLKLADFGFSKKFNNKRIKHQTIVGTPLYMSIQILKGQSYTSKCDIWALGLIFYEMLMAKTPWTANTEYELINGIQTKPLILPQNISNFTKQFLKGCLQVHQKDRFDWDQLLRHPIFQNYFSGYIQSTQILQDKLKSFMNKLRFKIQSQNLDLDRIFSEKGYAKQSKLTFEQFQQFVQTIDSNISNQQTRFIFEKIDTDDSNTIDYSQLQAALKKYNIPMNSKKYQLIKMETSDTVSTAEIKKQLTNKIYNAFGKLRKTMRQKNITLNQFFQFYNINKNGQLKIDQFQIFIIKLDKTFNNQQIKVTFNLIDVDQSGQISFQQFYSYFCKITGQPMTNFMKKKSNDVKPQQNSCGNNTSNQNNPQFQNNFQNYSLNNSQNNYPNNFQNNFSNSFQNQNQSFQNFQGSNNFAQQQFTYNENPLMQPQMVGFNQNLIMFGINGMNQSGGSVNSNFNSGPFPQSGFNGGMNMNNNNGSGGFYPNQNGWR